MSFAQEIAKYSWQEIKEKIYHTSHQDVERALQQAGRASLDGFLALLSPVAGKYLEEMAQISHKLTLKRFGKTIQLYIPLYLSNECTNGCVYCGFNHQNKVKRKTLAMDEIMEESEEIKQMGFEHILLVTGEHPKKAGFQYLNTIVKELRKKFAQVSIEVQPMETEQYEELAHSGLNSVYLYQETYHRENYGMYHPNGKKADYAYRIETPERIGEAEIHKMGLGVLLGLEDWRVDSFFTGLHIRYLQRTFWKTNYSVSFPRLRPFVGSYQPNHVVSDKDLVQLITAYRIFDENLELALSTRESPYFRDHAFKLGITTMSAGSKTEPGGYKEQSDYLEQFQVADERSPEEIKQMLTHNGYEAVWKNWDESLQHI